MDEILKSAREKDEKIEALTKKANTFEGCYNGLKFKYDEQVKEIAELVNALRLTHNKVYTIYHTKGALKRKDLDIDLIKAFHISGNALYDGKKYMIAKDWDKNRYNTK